MGLEEVPIDRAPSVESVVTAFLISHQRHKPDACLCGPLQLGTSHCAHVAGILSKAKLLAPDVPVHPSFPIEGVDGMNQDEPRIDPPPRVLSNAVWLTVKGQTEFTLQELEFDRYGDDGEPNGQTFRVWELAGERVWTDPRTGEDTLVGLALQMGGDLGERMYPELIGSWKNMVEVGIAQRAAERGLLSYGSGKA